MNEDEFVEYCELEPENASTTPNNTSQVDMNGQEDPFSYTQAGVTQLITWIKLIAQGGAILPATEINMNDVDISIYGENNNSYLFIEIYRSEHSANQYFFHTDNRQNPLLSLLQWLNCVDYNLISLLSLLENADYQETIRGPETNHQGMTITRSFQQQNKP